jgi:hypothetical protein
MGSVRALRTRARVQRSHAIEAARAGQRDSGERFADRVPFTAPALQDAVALEAPSLSRLTGCKCFGNDKPEPNRAAGYRRGQVSANEAGRRLAVLGAMNKAFAHRPEYRGTGERRLPPASPTHGVPGRSAGRNEPTATARVGKKRWSVPNFRALYVTTCCWSVRCVQRVTVPPDRQLVNVAISRINAP